MFKRAQDSLAFRIPYVYKKLLSLYKPGKQNAVINPRLNLVMLCGLNQLSLLQEALVSIKKNFELLPSIYVFLDKDLSYNICKQNLSWLSIPNLTIIESSHCIGYHRKSGNELIALFAEQNPMGLKLAAILQIADLNHPVLYSDTDVLWFKDPSKTLAVLESDKQVSFALSEDFQPAYDQKLIEKANLSILMTAPFYCAGILFVKEALSFESKRILGELLQIAILQSNHFTEQTIFAYLNKVSNNGGFDKHEFSIILDDQFKLMPTKREKLVARHYIGPVRHQFWRDAFFMRLNFFS